MPEKTGVETKSLLAAPSCRQPNSCQFLNPPQKATRKSRFLLVVKDIGHFSLAVALPNKVAGTFP
jgi:hypothetical protein